MSRPTIVFCHGAWHSPAFFGKVIQKLEPLGYKCIPLAMPSVGRSPAVTSLDEDIALVRSTVLEELNAGREVMLHAHSWGGIPVCSALDGFSRAERESEGKSGAVTKLTFASSFVLDEGVSLQDAFGGYQDQWIVSEDGNLMLDQEMWLPMMYHDLPLEEANEWIAKLKGHSLATFQDKTRSAAWKKIPTAYLVLEDDRAMPTPLQDMIVAKIKEEGGEIETERLFVSHSPYIVKPDSVASFLRRAAGEKVE